MSFTAYGILALIHLVFFTWAVGRTSWFTTLQLAVGWPLTWILYAAMLAERLPDPSRVA